MTIFLGIDSDVWVIILTIIIAIETLYLIIQGRRKSSNEINPTTAEVIKEILKKVPTPSDLKEPPAFPREDIRRLEEKISSIKEARGLFILDSFIKLGNVECTQGNLEKALIYYSEVLKQAFSIGDSKRIVSCLNNIGIVYFERGDLDTALKYYENALKIGKNIKYKRGEANILHNIGIVYFERGDLDTALKYYENALKIDRDTGYKQGEAITLGNMAIIYRKIGKSSKVQEYQGEADKIKEYTKR